MMRGQSRQDFSAPSAVEKAIDRGGRRGAQRLWLRPWAALRPSRLCGEANAASRVLLLITPQRRRRGLDDINQFTGV